MGRQNGDTAELDRLVQRIRALRAKTVEHGCTEQEALAAAGKVAELLDRYGLSLSEFDLRRQSCEGIGVETDRKRRGPIDDCMATIAAFFDCGKAKRATWRGCRRCPRCARSSMKRGGLPQQSSLILTGGP